MTKGSMPRCSADPDEALRRLRRYVRMCLEVGLSVPEPRSPQWYWIRYIALGIAACLEDIENALGSTTSSHLFNRLKELANLVYVGSYSSVDDEELVSLLKTVCRDLASRRILTPDHSVSTL